MIINFIWGAAGKIQSVRIIPQSPSGYIPPVDIPEAEKNPKVIQLSKEADVLYDELMEKYNTLAGKFFTDVDVLFDSSNFKNEEFYYGDNDSKSFNDILLEKAKECCGNKMHQFINRKLEEIIRIAYPDIVAEVERVEKEAKQVYDTAQAKQKEDAIRVRKLWAEFEALTGIHTLELDVDKLEAAIKKIKDNKCVKN